MPRHLRILLLPLLALAGGLLARVPPGGAQELPPGWWKGNLHTHSLWSDGDDYPEMITRWYKEHGYHFLALSDHNVLSEGERWIDAARSRGGLPALMKYRQRFGSDWVETRERDGAQQVRLRPLAEFRGRFEEPGRFLMIQSEEITAERTVHVNATNLQKLITPRGGETTLAVMQNNVDAVLAQRRETGQPMFPHLNHPNFHWAVTAEDLMQVRGERFFEVYNGHPQVYNEGDARHASTERIWDIVLAHRLAEPRVEPMYGLATDDSHHYHAFGPSHPNSGRGWIVVRAPGLTAAAIVAAMEQGDFYASTGVRLRTVERAGNRLALEIVPEPGVTYATQFIGTRRNAGRRSEPVRDTDGMPLPVTRRYSDAIGAVLAEVPGLSPAYPLRGDELYVRAKVTSSKPQLNPCRPGDLESAWSQPLLAPDVAARVIPPPS
jgi:hypothetical protein